MTSIDAERRTLSLLADLMEYPRVVPVSTARECSVLAGSAVPPAGAEIAKFADFLETVELGSLQELYSQAFDLEATWHPYVGYHLFGETYQRSQFLVGLQERYRANGFSRPESELADHISVVLRFVSTCEDDELASELVTDALEPMLTKMMAPKKDKNEVAAEQSGCDGCAPDGQIELMGDEVEPDPRPDPAPDLSAHPYRALLKALKLVIDDIAARVRMTPAAIDLRVGARPKTA